MLPELHGCGALHERRSTDTRRLRHASTPAPPRALNFAASCASVTSPDALGVEERWAQPTTIEGRSYGPPRGDADPRLVVKLESACEQDLRLRLGPGEITTMPAESFARLALPNGSSVAIVDADGHEVASWVSAAGKQLVRIASSCQAIVAL